VQLGNEGEALRNYQIFQISKVGNEVETNRFAGSEDFHPEMRGNGLLKREVDPLRPLSGLRDKVLRLRSVVPAGVKWGFSPRSAQDDGIRRVRFTR
jgi:hypothetical protein